MRYFDDLRAYHHARAEPRADSSPRVTLTDARALAARSVERLEELGDAWRVLRGKNKQLEQELEAAEHLCSQRCFERNYAQIAAFREATAILQRQRSTILTNLEQIQAKYAHLTLLNASLEVAIQRYVAQS